jgi:hypothetical protein
MKLLVQEVQFKCEYISLVTMFFGDLQPGYLAVWLVINFGQPDAFIVQH